MRVNLKDGFVCCSLEDKNKAFLSDCYGLFDGYKGSNLFMAKYNEGKADWAYPEVGKEEDLAALDRLIENAEKHGITVEREVIDLRDKLSVIVAEAAKKRRLREEERKAKELWESVCKHGCGHCNQLHLIDGEIPSCGYSGELLEERMDGRWATDRQTFKQFIYNPIPGQGCKYNPKNLREVE